jgi:hypothetical protein
LETQFTEREIYVDKVFSEICLFSMYCNSDLNIKVLTSYQIMQRVAKVRKSYQAATSKTVSNCKENIRYSRCRFDINLLILKTLKTSLKSKMAEPTRKTFKITIKKGICKAA